MSFKVTIPQPSVDRLKPYKLILRHNSGFCGYSSDKFTDLNPDETIVKIAYHRRLKWPRESVKDDSYDTIIICYQNSTGSRTEEIHLTQNEVEEYDVPSE